MRRRLLDALTTAALELLWWGVILALSTSPCWQFCYWDAVAH